MTETQELSEAEAVQVAAFGLDKPDDASYEPPMGKGQRVIATAANELVPEGTLGTITWTHPNPDMPYRVQWDGHEVKPGEFYMGMSDIGWLTRPHELEAIDAEAVDKPKPYIVHVYGPDDIEEFDSWLEAVTYATVCNAQAVEYVARRFTEEREEPPYLTRLWATPYTRQHALEAGVI